MSHNILMATVQKLSDAQALTTTLTATTYSSEISGCNVHDIHIFWTPGTTGNVLTYTVEFKNNESSTWVQEMTWDGSVSAGTQTNTKTFQRYQETATGTSVVPLLLSLQGSGHQIRLKVAESEAGGATKGTITIVAFSRVH